MLLGYVFFIEAVIVSANPFFPQPCLFRVHPEQGLPCAKLTEDCVGNLPADKKSSEMKIPKVATISSILKDAKRGNKTQESHLTLQTRQNKHSNILMQLLKSVSQAPPPLIHIKL